MSNRWRKRLFFVVGLLAASPAAEANIRAPRSHCRPGAGAPSAPATEPKLVVLGETINVWCLKTRCSVEVVYDIQSGAVEERTYVFLAPFGDTLDITLDKRRLRYTGAALDDAAWAKIKAELRDCQSTNDEERREVPIRQGRFATAWTPGRHKLKMEYTQELGWREYDYGYFSDGDIIKSFVYDLWPLRTWTLGPKFKIEVMVKASEDVPSFFTALGGFERLKCEGLGVVEDGAFDRPDQVMLKGTFGRNFPDRLVCHIQDNGDEPL